MLLQMGKLCKLLFTDFAVVRFDAQVDAHVLGQVGGIGKGLGALLALVGLGFAHVWLNMHLVLGLWIQHLHKKYQHWLYPVHKIQTYSSKSSTPLFQTPCSNIFFKTFLIILLYYYFRHFCYIFGVVESQRGSSVFCVRNFWAKSELLEFSWIYRTFWFRTMRDRCLWLWDLLIRRSVLSSNDVFETIKLLQYCPDACLRSRSGEPSKVRQLPNFAVDTMIM